MQTADDVLRGNAAYCDVTGFLGQAYRVRHMLKFWACEQNIWYTGVLSSQLSSGIGFFRMYINQTTEYLLLK